MVQRWSLFEGPGIEGLESKFAYELSNGGLGRIVIARKEHDRSSVKTIACRRRFRADLD